VITAKGKLTIYFLPEEEKKGRLGRAMELAKVCMPYCNFKNINRITNTSTIFQNKKYYIYNNFIYIQH
jgi:hypothetical protein